jgi:hypothetical protein
MKRLLPLTLPGTEVLLAGYEDEQRPEKLRVIMQRNLSAQAKGYVDSLHFIMCSSEACIYIEEESRVKTWECPEHMQMTDVGALLMDKYGFTLDEWSSVIATYIKVKVLLDNHPKSNDLFSALIFKPFELFDELLGIVTKQNPFSL